MNTIENNTGMKPHMYPNDANLQIPVVFITSIFPFDVFPPLVTARRTSYDVPCCSLLTPIQLFENCCADNCQSDVPVYIH